MLATVSTLRTREIKHTEQYTRHRFVCKCNFFLAGILGRFHNSSLTNAYDTTLAQLRWPWPPPEALATQTHNTQFIESCFHSLMRSKMLANHLAGNSPSLS